MTSLGLAVGCGDDGSQTSQTTDAQPTTNTTVSTSETASTGEQTTGSPQPTTTAPPTTTDSTVSDTTDGTGVTTSTTDPGTSTDMVTVTDSTTSTSTTDDTTTADTTSTTDDTTSTSTTDGTSSTTNGSSSTTEGIPCDEHKGTLTPVVPNVMLVLDKSGSMLNLWDHDGNANTPQVTRWYSLWAVVNDVLTAFNADFNFGMNLFPSKTANGNYNVGACPVNGNVEVKVAPYNKNAIIGALPAQGNNTIQGGTPAAAGVTSALNHLKSLDPMVPRAIMLITDGAANCTSGAVAPALFESYDQTLHTVVAGAFNNDAIPTYVIGIAIANMLSPPAPNMDGNPDSTNPYVKLNELATQGGTAKAGPEKFYNAGNQNELQAALEAIVSDAQSCVIPLDVEPGFPQFTKVKIGNVEVPKIMDCASQNGWKYVDPAPPYVAIELCGTACASLKDAGEADVEYYCTPG